MNKPLLLKLLVLYLFFLPLKSVEIPGVFIGFSINPARLFALLIVLVLFMNACLDRRYLNKIFRPGVYSNPFLNLLLIYFLFSILFYYISLTLGETVLFGGKDFFFRSWKGRPIGQLISFMTYAVIPFFVIVKYSQDEKKRLIIEKTLVLTTILLLYYGYFQMISFYFGLPVTGRDLYEGRFAAERIMGIVFLRFYSLGGEPRSFGGFIVGAMVFYGYFNYGKKGFFYKFNIILMFAALLLTFSTTAFIILFSSAVALMIDLIGKRRIKQIFKYLLISSLIITVLFSTGLINIIGARTFSAYNAYVRYFQNFEAGVHTNISHGVTSQSEYTSAIFYFTHLTDISPINLLFGFGYGNFATGIFSIMKEYFNYDIVQMGFIPDAGFYAYSFFVECGIIGSLILLKMYFYTLKLNNRLLRFYKKNDNVMEYRKTLMLRYTFIVFFVSNAISISFYYFIIMGLITGKFLGVYNSSLKTNAE